MAAREQDTTLTEAEVRDSLCQLGPLWEVLLSAEHARILHLLVSRAEVSSDGASIQLRTDGRTILVTHLRHRPERGRQTEAREAA
jgi:hypothetical protein